MRSKKCSVRCHPLATGLLGNFVSEEVDDLNGRLPATVLARRNGSLVRLPASPRARLQPTSYRESFKRRRRLAPTTGWYECQKIDAKTQRPFHFQPKAQPIALGGVYRLRAR